jgi:hypothetical protein
MNLTLFDPINQSVFLVNPSAPPATQFMLELLWLAKPRIGIIPDVLN